MCFVNDHNALLALIQHHLDTKGPEFLMDAHKVLFRVGSNKELDWAYGRHGLKPEDLVNPFILDGPVQTDQDGWTPRIEIRPYPHHDLTYQGYYLLVGSKEKANFWKQSQLGHRVRASRYDAYRVQFHIKDLLGASKYCYPCESGHDWPGEVVVRSYRLNDPRIQLVDHR